MAGCLCPQLRGHMGGEERGRRRERDERGRRREREDSLGKAASHLPQPARPPGTAGEERAGLVRLRGTGEAPPAPKQ